jgi:hypothetical protein
MEDADSQVARVVHHGRQESIGGPPSEDEEQRQYDKERYRRQRRREPGGVEAPHGEAYGEHGGDGGQPHQERDGIRPAPRGLDEGAGQQDTAPCCVGHEHPEQRAGGGRQVQADGRAWRSRQLLPCAPAPLAGGGPSAQPCGDGSEQERAVPDPGVHRRPEGGDMVHQVRSPPQGGEPDQRVPGAALLEHVRSYYEALNSGDPDRVAEHFTEDAVHYYTRLGPHEGARTIGDHTKWAVDNIDGQWFMENGIEDGEQACIEWTMTWRDPKSGERRLAPGAELFRIPRA